MAKPAALALAYRADDFQTILDDSGLRESDNLAFYKIKKGKNPKLIPANDKSHEPKFIMVVDVGSNSVKAEVFEVTENGLVSRFKYGEQCGLSQGTKPNDPDHARLNEAAIIKVREVISKFSKLLNGEAIDDSKKTFDSIDTVTVFCTEAVRASLHAAIQNEDEDEIVAIKDLMDFIEEKIAPPVIASGELEIELSIGTVRLDGAPEEQSDQRFENGVMYVGGGASVQAAELKDGKVYKNRKAVLHIGARTLSAAEDVDRAINEAISTDAKWLDPKQLQSTDACFAGGMFRVVGRLLAERLKDYSTIGKGMPLSGHTFSFRTQEEFQTIRSELLKMKEATSDELFQRAFVVERKALMDLIEKAKEKPDQTEVRIAGVMVKIEDIEKKIDKWKDRIESRYNSLPTDVDFVLNHMKRMYGDGSQLPTRDTLRSSHKTHSMTFSGGSSRMAAASMAPGHT